MLNVHESAQTINFDTALRTAAAKARTRYAGETARVDRGLLLALNGAVTLHTDGTATVQSGSDAEVQYTVNGHCDCPDAVKAPEGRCKHRWSKSLARWAYKALAEEIAQRYYASYTTPWNEVWQGIAEWNDTQRMTLFTPDCGADPLWAAPAALVLGGRCDIADTKRAEEEAAGGLAYLVCHHNGTVTK